MNNLTNEYMRKSVFTLCLLLVWSLAVVGQTESTSSATITFFRTPSSLLPGLFSVSETKRVKFAKGNLQYLASQKIWRFADHQYDIIGDAPGNTTPEAQRSNQGYWIDYFGWGTSGYRSDGAKAWQPWHTSTTNSDYCPNVKSEASWSGAYANCDWGTHNFTSNFDEGYRVLTADEWYYLFYTRRGTKDDNDATTLKGIGTLFGMPGLFLLPDYWSWSDIDSEILEKADNFVFIGDNNNFSRNVIKDNSDGHALWSAMETNGAVFLPAAGWREGLTVNNVGLSLYYHTSTSAAASTSESMKSVAFGNNGANIANLVSSSGRRMIGRSVRLVKDY